MIDIDKTYIPYHVHTEYSLLDSCDKPEDYIALAVRDGAKAISFSEHGKPTNWCYKWELCKQAGIKYMHSVEIYLTESLENKVRDNYHTILIAKNMDGVRELNSIVSMSCDSQHFYYTNRISFDEFLSLSDNIISTSACLASPLNKLDKTHPRYIDLAKKYDFLEVQPHNHPEQIEFNKRLLELSKELNKPLIVGTDTHSSSKYKAECRSVLLTAKHKSYGDEDAFDLSYKTYDELVEMFKTQDALPESEYMDALNNTNLLNDMTENIEVDTSIKYPILYGSAEEDERIYRELVETKFRQKLNEGVIPKEQEANFRKAIDEELEVFHKLGMNGFMLSEAELVSWCKEQGMAIGTARGSIGGSRVAYITDIIDLNPETWKTMFSRFANVNRVEPGDIDTDVIDTDRPAIFNHIKEVFGEKKTARVASFGTLQDKAVIDEVGRALAIRWEQNKKGIVNPWGLSQIKKIKAEFDTDPEKTKHKYPELFYYMDGLLGVKISQSVHPAGMVISPLDLSKEYGTFDKEGEQCLMLDMDCAHEVGAIKYDFLILKSVKVIRDTCSYIGVDYPKSNEINFDDKNVWDDIQKNPSLIFQFESPFAGDSLKKFKPQSIFDMSLVTACIRPSGASYRNELLQRHEHKNPSELIDNLLKDNLGFLVYQEDVIRFLTDICGFDGSTADSVRRGIAKKRMDILDEFMPKIIEGYCQKSASPRDQAEAEARDYVKIIEDASSYMFGYNHSIAYCLLGYYYAYYRYYYPLEFLTAYLNNAANEDDIKNGTLYANKIGIKVTMPKWGFSKGHYFYDKEKRVIAKGLSSVKYMSESVANELYELSHRTSCVRFVDVLKELYNHTSVDARQLDILIKIDYFSDFGNQRELLRITDMFYDLFKCGNAKKIHKGKIQGTILEPIIEKYAVCVNKDGSSSKSYTILDIGSILNETEDAVRALHLADLNDIIKIRNFVDLMGYVGYVSGNESDRRKLYVTGVKPLCRKKDGKQFGYSVLTKSIGSGKEARFSVLNRLFDSDPISENDIIYLTNFSRDGQYFNLTGYHHVYTN